MSPWPGAPPPPSVFPWVISVLSICLLSIHFLLHRTTTKRRLEKMYGLDSRVCCLLSLWPWARGYFFFHPRTGNNNTHLKWLWEGLGKVHSVPGLQKWHLSIGITAFLCHLNKHCLSFLEEAVHFPSLLLCAQLTQGNVELLKSLRKGPIAIFFF